MESEEKLTELQWYEKVKDKATLFDIKWSEIKSWITDAKLKGFDVTDYLPKQKVKEAFDRALERYTIMKEDNKRVLGEDYELFNNKLSVFDWLKKELELE